MALLICVVSVVGFVLAYVFQWPSEFVAGEITEHYVTLADIGSGTVTSIPLAPWIALVVFALLARSRRWWGDPRGSRAVLARYALHHRRTRRSVHAAYALRSSRGTHRGWRGVRCTGCSFTGVRRR